jgi:plasmid stabilization system protein ParE
VPIKIEVSPEAQRMLDEADERWISEHGYDVDNPLLDEVPEAVALLRAAPELGVSYQHQSFRRGIRRLLLRSGWHLYYSFDASRSLIVIVAVWFAARGAGPSV